MGEAHFAQVPLDQYRRIMGTFNLKSFSEPERLKTIEAGRLLSFLAPHASYLRDRGYSLPSGGAIDYDRLAKVLMHPDDQVPTANPRLGAMAETG